MTKRGFTYIELGAVLLILLLTAALVTPRYASLARARALTDYRDGLTWMVGTAREAAINRGQAVDLRYVEDRRELQIVVADTQASNGPTVGAQDSNATPITSLAAPEGVQAVSFRSEATNQSDAAWSVRFYPDGTSTNGGIEFTVGDDDYSLVVDTNAAGKTVDGSIPEETADDWEAGDYVRRTE